LDEGGGPNWSGNFVDSPIIINKSVDEFYKQPMYYALGHFSKYIPEGSVRIGMNVIDGSKFFGAAFLRPDGRRAVVLLNRYKKNHIIICKSCESLKAEISSFQIKTGYTYKVGRP
jgi:glucosylceramidase